MNGSADKKVLEYLERAREIYGKWIEGIDDEDDERDVEVVLQIARMIQNEVLYS